MRVYVHRNETSHPILYVNVVNAYTKGGLYCIRLDGNRITHKYPLCTIFRIVEEED